LLIAPNILRRLPSEGTPPPAYRAWNSSALRSGGAVLSWSITRQREAE
jgi:hypothetical protein